MKRVCKIFLLMLSLTLILASSVLTVFAEQSKAEEALVENFLVEETYVDENGNLIYLLEDGRKYDPAKKQFVEEEIEGMSLSLNFDRVVSSLKYMWQGMLCIFVVIGVIILVTILMNSLCNKADEKKKLREEKKGN